MSSSNWGGNFESKNKNNCNNNLEYSKTSNINDKIFPYVSSVELSNLDLNKVIDSLLLKFNKTKYFRLRLNDEVSSERPKKDLRLT